MEKVIDYSDRRNWAYFKKGKKKTADLFIVGPTVDLGEGGNRRADIRNTKFRISLKAMLNTMLGIYDRDAVVYAPYYRQITFPTYKLPIKELYAELDDVYKDVREAFLHYARQSEAHRPIILAGFSQGADMTMRLVEEFFCEPKYKDRFVAAYCIGWKLTKAMAARSNNLRPAQCEDDTGVIISFNSEAEYITSSRLVRENVQTYSINPLNWKTDGTMADRSENIGACFTDYFGFITREVPNFTGAYIDQKRGTLKAVDVDPAHFSNPLFEDGVYHLYDYQFFYRNLQKNVQTRLKAFIDKK